ncbi:MAG: hypothetical protein MZW92_72105 [Comamonadaceae bacterium]|nr:hypothetical protein [Comamonadaceae bacterium]
MFSLSRGRHRLPARRHASSAPTRRWPTLTGYAAPELTALDGAALYVEHARVRRFRVAQSEAGAARQRALPGRAAAAPARRQPDVGAGRGAAGGCRRRRAPA